MLDLTDHHIHARCTAPVDRSRAEPDEAAFDRWEVELQQFRENGEPIRLLSAVVFRLRDASSTNLIDAADAQSDTHFLDRVCLDGLTETGEVIDPVREALGDDICLDVVVIAFPGRTDPAPALHYGVLGRGILDLLAGPHAACFFEDVPNAPTIWADSVGAARVASCRSRRACRASMEGGRGRCRWCSGSGLR